MPSDHAVYYISARVESGRDVHDLRVGIVRLAVDAGAGLPTRVRPAAGRVDLDWRMETTAAEIANLAALFYDRAADGLSLLVVHRVGGVTGTGLADDTGTAVVR